MPPAPLHLCRGDEVLGRLEALPQQRERSEQDGGDRQLLAAIIPSPPFGRLEPMAQHRVESLPGQPIHQHPMAPRHMPTLRVPGSSIWGRMEAPMHPISEAEARGVSPRRQLVVSTADGRTFCPHSLMLWQLIIAPGTPLPANEPIPEGALVDGSLWSLVASFREQDGFPY
jgi:hypothetical protein